MKRLVIILVACLGIAGSSYAVDSTLVFAERAAALATMIDANPTADKQFNFGASNQLYMADNNQGNEAWLYRPSAFTYFPATFTTDSVKIKCVAKAVRSVAGTNTANGWRMLVNWVEGTGTGVAAQAGSTSFDSSLHGTVDWNSADVRILGNGVERTAAIQVTATIPAVLAVGDSVFFTLPKTQWDSLVDGLLSNFGYIISFDSVENNNSRLIFFGDDDLDAATTATGGASGQKKISCNSVAAFTVGDRFRVGPTKTTSREYIVGSATSYAGDDTIVTTIDLAATVNSGDSLHVSNQPEIWWWGNNTGSPAAGQRRMRMMRKQ